MGEGQEMIGEEGRHCCGIRSSLFQSVLLMKSLCAISPGHAAYPSGRPVLLSSVSGLFEPLRVFTARIDWVNFLLQDLSWDRKIYLAESRDVKVGLMSGSRNSLS